MGAKNLKGGKKPQKYSFFSFRVPVGLVFNKKTLFFFFLNPPNCYKGAPKNTRFSKGPTL